MDLHEYRYQNFRKRIISGTSLGHTHKRVDQREELCLNCYSVTKLKTCIRDA